MSRFDAPGLPPTTAASAMAQAAESRAIDAAREPLDVAVAADHPFRVGVICNPLSHQNVRAALADQELAPDILLAAPRTHGELAATLAEFAAQGLHLLVIDGGDGTVRDVLTAAAEAFGETLPQIAILPNGKTNALALDLGVPDNWSLDAALTAARTGGIRRRSALVVTRSRASAPPLHGFLLGAGAFVLASELAQRTHRVGAFRGLAVALALVWALLQMFFGRPTGVWRRGVDMHIATKEETLADGATFLFFASTLESLPTGVRPLGRPRAGLKTLTVQAPPRFIQYGSLAVVAGKVGGWLERNGYRHRDLAEAEVRISGGFILDGDHYDDELVTLTQGEPIAFVVP